MALLGWVILLPISNWAAEVRPTAEERLIRLEEGQKALNQKIDDLEKRFNQRIDDLEKRLNQRIDDLEKALNGRIDDLRHDVNNRFTWLYILLSAIIALNGAMVGSVIWMARQDRPIGQRHYDQMLSREEELERELREVKRRLDALDQRLSQRLS